jgi:hypothetical protein
MMSDERSENNILMPIPVVPAGDSRMVTATKMLSWLTAMLLAASVLVSLVAVTQDRNELKAQIEAQSQELACRSAANIDVLSAMSSKQILIGDQNLVLGQLVVAYIRTETDEIPQLITELESVNGQISAAGGILEDAITRQGSAIVDCKNPD